MVSFQSLMTPPRGGVPRTQATPNRGVRGMLGAMAGALLATAGCDVATQTPAPAPRLQSPVACEIGRTCFIQQYVDADSGPGARDHRCGVKAYDGHDGTDFRVPSRAAMAAGVEVRAALGGTVKSVRDGEPDGAGSPAELAAVRGKECGNGVVLTHPGGWETQYCHMERGSVRVRPGQAVAAGAPLGRIGQSGEAAFPHLHLSVRENGRAVDPFAYGAAPGACNAGRSLWRAPIAYRAPETINAGFSPAEITMAQVESGVATPVTRQSPAMVAYARAIGLRADDVVTLALAGPEGPLAENRYVLPRNQAQHFLFTGKRNRAGAWPAGEYRARYTVRRRGATVLEHAFSTRL